jgi:hypothetical protein
LSGADLSKVLFVRDVMHLGERRAFDPASDVEPLRLALAERGGCRLLIVDPIVSAVAGDSHKNAETRRGLAPLVDLASNLGCALLGITHLSKGTEHRDPVERVTGSLAFGALARTVLLAAKGKPTDDGGPPVRVLMRAKNNLGQDTGGFEYHLEQGEVHGHSGLFASHTVWGDAIEGDARELMAEVEAQPADDEGDEARDWLVAYLDDRGGRAPKKEIAAAARASGFSQRTMDRARARAGITYEVAGYGPDKHSIWQLAHRANHVNRVTNRPNPKNSDAIDNRDANGVNAGFAEGGFCQSRQSRHTAESGTIGDADDDDYIGEVAE